MTNQPDPRRIGTRRLREIIAEQDRLEAIVQADKLTKRQRLERTRQQLKADVEAWLAKGNRITQVPGYECGPVRSMAVAYDRRGQ